MKVYVIILILIMLLLKGMTRVCAQEHRHKIDSVNNIVLYFKIVAYATEKMLFIYYNLNIK